MSVSTFRDRRRILLVIVAAAALLSLALAGCRPRDTQDGRIELVLTSAGGVEERELYRAVIEEFEAEHPNIQVRLLPISRDYYQKVLVMIAGRDAPDLIWMGQSFGEFATRGAFMDLTDRIEQEVDTDEYFPGPLSWYNIDGRQLGIPFAIDMDFVVYNKDLLDQAGVPYPTDEWTGEDLLEMAKQLTRDTDGDGRTDQFGYRGGVDSSAFGAEIVSDDGKTPLCNSPEMIDYLQFTLDVVHKWKVSPLPNDLEQEGLDAFEAFRGGKAAMMRFYTWDLAELPIKFADMNWDIVMMPRFAKRSHWASSQAVLVSADTPHPDEAWELAKCFFGDEFQRAMSFRGLPPNRRVAEEIMAEHQGDPENLRALFKASDYLHPFPRVPHLR